LSADGSASASKIEKMAKKLKKISVFEKNSKAEVEKLNICACLSRLIKLDENKITWNILCWEFLSGHFTRTKKSFFKNRHSTFK
jgi:hypothetical protein